jgi:hypothetical protein
VAHAARAHVGAAAAGRWAGGGGDVRGVFRGAPYVAGDLTAALAGAPVREQELRTTAASRGARPRAGAATALRAPGNGVLDGWLPLLRQANASQAQPLATWLGALLLTRVRTAGELRVGAGRPERGAGRRTQEGPCAGVVLPPTPSAAGAGQSTPLLSQMYGAAWQPERPQRAGRLADRLARIGVGTGWAMPCPTRPPASVPPARRWDPLRFEMGPLSRGASERRELLGEPPSGVPITVQSP